MGRRTKKPIIRIVEYNNKTRKGKYIKVRVKGEKGRITRYDDRVPLDVYIKGQKLNWNRKKYREQIEAWTKEDQKSTRIKDAYKRKLKAAGRLSDRFAPGLSSVRLFMHELNSQAKIRQAYEALFRPLILDEQFLDIIIQNREKMRYRYSYKMTVNGTTIKNQDVHTVGHITDIGNIS